MADWYRTKPVQAVQWTGDNEAELHEFTDGEFYVPDPEDRSDDPDATGAFRDAHGCWVLMLTGTWIIRVGEHHEAMDDEAFRARFIRVEPSPAVEFLCSLCIFEEPRELTDEQRAERSVLTIMNGQLICMEHTGYAGGARHSMMLVSLREQVAGRG